MAQHDDRRGGKFDMTIPYGVAFTKSISFTNDSGLVTSIASATLKFAVGNTGEVSSPYTGAVVPVTVVGGTYMLCPFQVADTQAFSFGTEYCYALRATLNDGSVLQILYGEILVDREIGVTPP